MTMQSTTGVPRRTTAAPGLVARRIADAHGPGYHLGPETGRARRAYDDGDEYEGGFRDDQRDGRGAWRRADGRVDYITSEKGQAVGEGVTWSADRKTAKRLIGGRPGAPLTTEEADRIAREHFGLRAPEPAKATLKAAAAEAGAKGTSSGGLLGGLFATRRTDPDGTRHFKGEWIKCC